MKIHYAWLILAVVVAVTIGIFVGKISESIKITQRLSLAGQTLVDLSRALESEKERTGHYPKSIPQVSASSEDSEFSTDILRDTIYYKTEDGYIAFVGLPKVAYIYPGVSTSFK
jgi:hypothetical protein